MIKCAVICKVEDSARAILENHPEVEWIALSELPKKDIPPFQGLWVEEGTTIDADFFSAAQGLGVLGVLGESLEGIDLDAATRNGVAVIQVSTRNVTVAVEHAMGLMMSLCRNVPRADRSMKQNKWNRKAFAGSQLYDKHLGIVGLGRVGARMAEVGRAFGMKVAAFDPYAPDDRFASDTRRVETLGELLAASDFVSVHVPVTPKTAGLIDQAALGVIKEGARLIDTSGEGVVDLAALKEALERGRLAGAALDWAPDDAGLKAMEQVVMTPHLAGGSLESRSAAEEKLAHAILHALVDNKYEHVVNSSFLAQTDWSHVGPYADLAERMGLLARQLVQGAIKKVTVQIKGEIESPEPISAAFLSGLLSTALGGRVNMVNARVLAAERGISLQQARTTHARDFNNLVLVSIESESEHREFSGVLLGNKYLRIVKIDDYYLDVIPEGLLLFISNEDQPGVIAGVSGCLARANINIAGWQLGRRQPGGHALAVVNLDSAPTPGVLDEIRKVAHVLDLVLVDLGKQRHAP